MMEKKNKMVILAVDDEPLNLDLLELAFAENTGVEFLRAKNGKEALEILDSGKDVDVILLDLSMPVMNGFETLKVLKSNEKFRYIPVIVITANAEEKKKALSLGANDFIPKPFDIEEIKLRTKNYVDIKHYNDFLRNVTTILEEQVKERTKQLQEALKLSKELEYEIALKLGKTAEFRDIETGMHIMRVSHGSKKLAELYGLPKEEQELILYASPLHDVGKVGIPDSILLKPERLTPEEFEIMKQHTIIGAKILDGGEKYPVLKAGKIIALQHHERWDGKGYPYGLKGEEIHIYGRIVAIVDVFDALISPRVYKPAFPLEKAIEIMREGKGTQFDPELLDLFLNNIESFLKIKERFSDKDEKNEGLDSRG
ncbi:response regulator [Thermodesulfobacterium sp. TA1]|nr:response regulator [Thermodesulfobacterium sp. TA1]